MNWRKGPTNRAIFTRRPFTLKGKLNQFALQELYNTLIDSYLEDNIGIASNVVSESLATGLKENLLLLFDLHKLEQAGTGNDQRNHVDKTVRGDEISWLDRHKGNIHENRFFELVDGFILFLNTNCYTGINGFEFHYARYEKGSFYSKHKDQFQNNNSRQFSMILYLNPDWDEKDGGELSIQTSQGIRRISPSHGKIVFFKSAEMVHEVLPTNKARLSITGWLKTNPY